MNTNGGRASNRSESRAAEMNSGTLRQIEQMVLESLRRMTPEERHQFRKHVYESMTRKPYRPATHEVFTDDDREWLRSIGITA